MIEGISELTESFDVDVIDWNNTLCRGRRLECIHCQRTNEHCLVGAIYVRPGDESHHHEGSELVRAVTIEYEPGVLVQVEDWA